jgi:uncharacterized protein YuzE
VDLNEEGSIVGIEIWNASRNIVESLAESLVEKVKEKNAETATK